MVSKNADADHAAINLVYLPPVIGNETPTGTREDDQHEAPTPNRPNYSDGKNNGVVVKLLCFAYILSMVIIALFAYGCTATAYMYSYGTTLAIWLSVFLTCAVCCGLLGFATYEDGPGIVPAYCAGTCIV